MPISARRNTNIASENKYEGQDGDIPVEVHDIYSTTLASNPGEAKQYKNACVNY